MQRPRPERPPLTDRLRPLTPWGHSIWSPVLGTLLTVALYRKYRPATFAEVVGQEHVTEPLCTALAAGRINHAYLFSGPRGCGKTSSARILARSLNCEQGPTPDPCGVCDSCVALAPDGPGLAGRHGARRGQPRRRRRRPRAARPGVLRARRVALPGVHHRRGAHGHHAGLQRAAEDRRGAAGAPGLRLRHHRAGEGAADHPVAHPPLPVPADPADAPCGRCWKGCARARASTSSRRCSRW